MIGFHERQLADMSRDLGLGSMLSAVMVHGGAERGFRTSECALGNVVAWRLTGATHGSEDTLHVRGGEMRTPSVESG